jgi:uncharacterized membrane protein YphA (DoxX/SURF4 family)
MSSIISYGLLPIRIMAGIVFIAHGIPKFMIYQVDMVFLIS